MKNKTNRQQSILVVDDSFDMLELLGRNLDKLDYVTFTAPSVVEAIDILEHTPVDLLITDLQMPGISGLQLVRYMAEKYPQIPVLVITGYPSVKGAVEAIQTGAIEYLVKPFTIDELEESVKKILSGGITPGNKKNTKESLPLSFSGIIGQAPAMQKMFNIIQRVAKNRATVLISGESGTGKELIARALHYTGPYSAAPFIAVNCGAIPEHLMESELFGFTKGSFTGASETRAGLFQAADGGTIFLDEISNTSMALQAKLLRVLQEKEVMMIGAKKTHPVQLRVIAASNADLAEMVHKGNFREDLYYRLNVISIQAPPLRERKEDIPQLTTYFLQKFSREFSTSSPVISDEAMQQLMAHNWPGNVRELENIVQQLVILCDGIITAKHLPSFLQNHYTGESKGEGSFKTLKEAEKEYIEKVLKSVNNNKTKAAQILGIDRKTLREKLG